MIKIRDSFFFVTTCATSFRIMTPYFTMLVNKYSAKDSVIWCLLDHNALRFSLYLAESVQRKSRKPKMQRRVIVLFFIFFL